MCKPHEPGTMNDPIGSNDFLAKRQKMHPVSVTKSPKRLIRDQCGGLKTRIICLNRPYTLGDLFSVLHRPPNLCVHELDLHAQILIKPSGLSGFTP